MSVFDAAAALWGSGTAFRGADYSRLSSDRWVTASSPDAEIQYAARQLRARARDLVRNNPYAAGVAESFADNLIGWEGIRCKPTVMFSDGEPDRAINWELERGWSEWGADFVRREARRACDHDHFTLADDRGRVKDFRQAVNEVEVSRLAINISGANHCLIDRRCLCNVFVRRQLLHFFAQAGHVL